MNVFLKQSRKGTMGQLFNGDGKTLQVLTNELGLLFS
jgi:hypothetical protein